MHGRMYMNRRDMHREITKSACNCATLHASSLENVSLARLAEPLRVHTHAGSSSAVPPFCANPINSFSLVGPYRTVGGLRKASIDSIQCVATTGETFSLEPTFRYEGARFFRCGHCVYITSSLIIAQGHLQLYILYELSVNEKQGTK